MTAPVSPVSAEEALRLCHEKMREAAEYIDGSKTNREARSSIKTAGDRIASELRNTIDATAPSGAKVPQWLPIETAPKDGTEFDVWCPEDSPPENGYRVADCWWCSADQKIRTYGDENRGWANQPTHWMRPPAAPAAAPVPPDPKVSEGMRLAQKWMR